MQWRKAAGRDATVDADIVSDPNHDTELQNFKITSDDIAAEGKIVVGTDNKVKQFEFPSLMLNVVSRLDVRGTRGNDDMWDIDIAGTNFDGRNFFRSLFNVGNGPDRKGKPPGSARARVTTQIDNVIGSSDVSLRNLKMQIETRDGNLTSLMPKARSMAARCLLPRSIRTPGTRRLLVDSSDAGQVMKLVNFYPNMQGGRCASKSISMAPGPRKKPALWCRRFQSSRRPDRQRGRQ